MCLTPLENAVGIVSRRDSDGLCDDEDPCIGAYDECMCAMDLAPFMIAGAAMSPKKIVTVRAINWMRSACAEVLAKPMTMRMGCVTQTSLWAAPCLPPATTTLRPKRTTAHVSFIVPAAPTPRLATLTKALCKLSRKLCVPVGFGHMRLCRQCLGCGGRLRRRMRFRHGWRWGV